MLEIPRHFGKMPKLDDMMKKFEKSILARLYTDYPSTRKLSSRLGISHTAVANKLREFGINNK